MPSTQNPKNKGPKTELDEKFLSIARQIMKSHGINSDRAISLALGRKPDFINRVSNGVQSATPEAWDILFSKYPEARSINVSVHGSGQAVGTVQGDNYYAPTTLEGCQQELEQHKLDLASTRAELERVQQQLVSQAALLEAKNELIASKDETISLLRGGYNRPN